MKLLDLPPNLCDHVAVEFFPENWTEFDKTVVWLVKNGVPLQTGYSYAESRLMVRIQKGRPYAGGDVIHNSLAKLTGSVSGNEMGVEYSVYFPDMIR